MPYSDVEKRRLFERKYWKEHRGKSSKKKQTWRLSSMTVKRYDGWKIETLTHYGGGRLACVRCGFTDARALTIDHIYNNGYSQRKELGLAGKGFYYWLRRNNYPEGYQTLCMNCQFIKRVEK